eukprot:TRINITY_DN24477_c0_g1_i1.p1 TRINITY_DN24477_c0_g1~~TRINITY_DN24477_c0_g1_i1.p1  ORF type:complete len:470 (+),score=106.54 TRINITY_DN24477_c0_g1_i1:92-1501(+)
MCIRDRDKAQYAPIVFQEAKNKFGNYSLGIARVNIAEASVLIETLSEHHKADYIGQLLEEALRILTRKDNCENLQGECYYLKAICAEKCRNSEMQRENLLLSLEKARVADNRAMEVMTRAMLNHLSTCMQQDYPLFVFLKSFPLVKKLPDDSVIALEPLAHTQDAFRVTMLECFERNQVAIKLDFDLLTRQNIKHAISRSCVGMQLSSSYYSHGVLALEGPSGELDKLKLADLRSLLASRIKLSQCKLVVLVLPNSEDIAQVLSDLGVPHVICFWLSHKAFSKYEGTVSAYKLYRQAVCSFSKEFYGFVVKGVTVQTAFDKAIELTVEAIKEMVKAFSSEEVRLEKSEVARIFPVDPDMSLHDVKLMSVFKLGRYIETSQRRGVCDIEKEKSPLIGRHLEFFKVISALRAQTCVNLYGHSGIGKTKLAKEVAYFLYRRSVFSSGIYLSLIHICRCRRYAVCRSRWSPYH